MQLTILQENLKNKVNLTSHFTSPKAHLPILGNILLRSSKSKLNLFATNLELSIKTTLAAKVEKIGEITVSGKTLNDLVSNLSAGLIELSVEKEQLKILSGTSKSTVLGVNSSDFPKIPEKLSKYSFTLKTGEFKNSLFKSLFAVSFDETRPILTGVLFVFKNKSLSLVSTDGFRLSEIKLKTEVDIDDFDVIIPKTILYELIKISESDQSSVKAGEIEVSFDKENNQVIFGIGETILSSRIIEGQFPDYKKIIPTQSTAIFYIEKSELEKAIKPASVFARDSGKIIRLQVIGDRLTVRAESASAGNQEMELEIRSDPPEGEVGEIDIMFNYSFIEDVLKVIEDDEVKIVIAPDNKAAKFLDPKSPNFLHIIMPIKNN